LPLEGAASKRESIGDVNRTDFPSTSTPAVYHGGNLSAARLRFPEAPAEWLDLSTGINSSPYPIGDLPASAWTRLPDPADIAALEAAAADAYGGKPEQAVAAPGTQALIRWLARLTVAILGLTYAEHERAWREAGAQVAVVEDFRLLAEADVAVIVNPNNPDGRLVGVDNLLELAAKLRSHGGKLIVDEAFIDVLSPRFSLAPHLPTVGAAVLRSFGKTYGLAGLRLGFALGSPDLAEPLRASLGPWAVSGPAVEIARRALADGDWLRETGDRLRRDAARLDLLLERAGMIVVGGTPLFRLAQSVEAGHLFERLGRAGILVRPFPARPCWLRFGIPSGSQEWARLEAALE
jgi:cobalamin biosynthetic protein CobC